MFKVRTNKELFRDVYFKKIEDYEIKFFYPLSFPHPPFCVLKCNYCKLSIALDFNGREEYKLGIGVKNLKDVYFSSAVLFKHGKSILMYDEGLLYSTQREYDFIFLTSQRVLFNKIKYLGDKNVRELLCQDYDEKLIPIVADAIEQAGFDEPHFRYWVHHEQPCVFWRNLKNVCLSSF